MQCTMELMRTPLPSGTWTLYFHAPKEKRWTLDTFQPLGKMSTLQDAVSMFQELGDKLRRGMYFCMKDPIPPLWENYQNIRGGSYSLRGSATGQRRIKFKFETNNRSSKRVNFIKMIKIILHRRI